MHLRVHSPRVTTAAYLQLRQRVLIYSQVRSFLLELGRVTQDELFFELVGSWRLSPLNGNTFLLLVRHFSFELLGASISSVGVFHWLMRIGSRLIQFGVNHSY